MPRVFTPVDITQEEKEVRKDYFDRHTPRIVCDMTAKRNKKFKVKVIIGEHYEHPDDSDHFISYIQLWNRETFLAEIHFTPGVFGSQASQVEVDFYIVPKQTMNIAAMAVCTKHGLWQSESSEIRVVD